MIIGSTQSLAKLSSTLVFSIEDVSLEEVHVQSYKYLGVVSIRTWNGHIDYIKSNENKKPELLKHIKNYLPIYCRLLFFIFSPCLTGLT